MIDLRNDPPTAIEIFRASKSTLSPGEKFLWFCPIPVVDFVGGMLIEAIHGNGKEELDYVQGAIDRDWSATELSRRYVEKVRLQRRQLIACEVEALKAAARS